MHKHWLLALGTGLLLIGATGCPDIDVDPAEEEVGPAALGPIVEFDPSAKIIPFPNNLLLDPMTGLVNLPAQCNESATSKATREQVLNKLDGFGTYEVGLQVTFSEPVDMASLTGKAVLYKRASGMTMVDPAAAQQVPVLIRTATTSRFSLDCATASMVDAVQIIPLVPLEQKSTYTVGLLSGIKTATGADFKSSFTWSLISQNDPPVVVENGIVTVNKTPLNPANPTDANMNGIGDDLEQLQGIALLWRAHAQGLAFLEAKGHTRDTVLLAWEFNTQTTTDPLDPAVAGSPADGVVEAPLQGLQSVVLQAANRTAGSPYEPCGSDSNVLCYLRVTLGRGSCNPTTTPACTTAAASYAVGTTICNQVGCAAVGDVLAGGFGSKQYQIDTPNPFDATKPIPGPWNDPRTPSVTKTETITALVFVPASPAPAAGYPVIVFGHGLGSSKNAVFAIGPQLAAPQAALGFTSGFVTVAIDDVAHGSRAVRISNTGACADGAAGAPSPSDFPQCYAPFLSPNLAGTRDNIRQSILDMQGLVEAVQACGTTMCTTPNANFQVDPTHVSYLGQSLGGIMGSVLVATKTELLSGVINVGGAGWVDILENTQTLAIKCSLVDGLIDAGIVIGDKFNPTNNTGLCTTDAWKTQPGYRQFASIGRWVLDPADPANFSRKLLGRKVLLQEVVGDLVVPNVATDNLGALLMLTPANADPATSAPPPPSAAITTNPMTAKFVKYPTITTPAPNTFAHASLLRPADSTAGGQLGTARLQSDAITYLIINR